MITTNIGVKESKFVNNIPTELDFASIVVVLDALTIQTVQVCDIVISNNNINHSTKYGPNISYSTGPLIFTKAYWEGATYNVAEYINFTISGNSFNPYGGKNSTDRIIKIDGADSVVYSNNTHTDIYSEDLREIPYIATTNVAKLVATNNIFGRHGTAFSHEYPDENHNEHSGNYWM